MPFKRNDPKTQAAARKGGSTGVKHFARAPKRKLKVISKKGGQARQEAWRKEQLKIANRYEHKVMHDFLP